MDHNERVEALDVQRSFLVQAPAGSGKTELLIQRILALLATIEQSPPEIVAITFTRKAAFEMQERVFSALRKALIGTLACSAHEEKTLALAKRALQNPLVKILLETPSSLRIQTIDAFVLHLAKRLPLLTTLGTEICIESTPISLYRKAVDALFQSEWINRFHVLLDYYPESIERLACLFSELLEKRDQWLPLLWKGKETTWIDLLERSCQEIIQEHLEKASISLAKQSLVRLNDVLYYALEKNLPLPIVSELSSWKQLLRLFITEEGCLRKTANKKIGFPAPSDTKDETEKAKRKHYKQLHQEVIEDFRKEASIEPLLHSIAMLPEPVFSETERVLLSTIMQVLPIVLASLLVEFKKKACVDYTEVILKVVSALDQSETPSLLLESIDPHMKHLLVDEFQDTSSIQYRLFELLVQDFQPYDGRTVFFVGDPMQSIYAFRGAEVSLFLRAKQQGIASLPLQYLLLKRNFRTIPELLSWSNRCFKALFPVKEDYTKGAVVFSESIASKPALSDTSKEPVVQYWQLSQEDITANRQLLDYIKNLQKRFPHQRIAVLVRVKAHLKKLMALLQAAQYPFYTPESGTLDQEWIVRDPLNLVRACFDFQHKAAWCALLRSPLIGVQEDELLRIVTDSKTSSLWEACQYLQRRIPVLKKVVPILEKWIAQRGQMPLRVWLSGVWYALGGNSLFRAENDRLLFEQFLKILGQTTHADRLQEAVLQLRLQQHGVSFGSEEAHLHLMTIHKAKGLEFDHVILFKVESVPRSSDLPLFQWLEITAEEKNHFLMFPKERFGERTSWYRFIADCVRLKNVYEQLRLFYVAVTRAKHTLCFFMQETDAKTPPPRSFAAYLDTVPLKMYPMLEEKREDTRAVLERIVRKSNNFNIASKNALEETALPNTPITPDKTMQAVGIVSHRLFKKLVDNPLAFFSKETIGQLLKTLVSPETPMKPLVSLVEQAVQNIQKSERGQWILGAHASSQAEWQLSRLYQGRLQTIIIDRSFVDKENRRWIIDYKLGAQEAIALADYWVQLEQYADWLYSFENSKIYLGLYFPLSDHWLEKEYQGE